MPPAISSTGKGDPKDAGNSQIVSRHDGMKQQQCCREDSEQEIVVQLAERVARLVAVSTSHMPLILRYVPKTSRKEGESPFIGCANER